MCTSPYDDSFMQFIVTNGIANLMNTPGFHAFEYLRQDIDSEFPAATDGIGYSSLVNTGSGGGSIVSEYLSSDGMTALLTANGVTMSARWIAGAPTSGSANEIVVNGGHWQISFAGYAPDMPPPYPAPAPPGGGAPATDGDLSIAPMNAVNANMEILFLSNTLHNLLNQNGGHLQITFTGKDGTIQHYNVEDLVNALDHYRIFWITETLRRSVAALVRLCKLQLAGKRTSIRRSWPDTCRFQAGCNI